MTADAKGPPKYARVAAAVRSQIADGTLRPGQPAPSGAALSRVSGYSTLTCRRALRVLIADGVLVPGPSRNARPRVAGAAPLPAERDLAAAGRALSAGLAARRRANGLTQPELALLAEISVTTVGHAETGRLWQSRRFWERADAALAAGGALLRLHDAYREAGAAEEREPGEREPGRWPQGHLAVPGTPGAVVSPGAGAQPAARVRPGPGQPSPACVTIVWSDGSVTTVHPPETTRAVTSPPVTSPAGTSPAR
jgi:Bacterial regulatory proteins, gntR family/Helix-turn-helix domain